MKIYKIDENSWKQQDTRTTRPQVSMYQGIHNLTADNISNKTPEEQASIEAKYIANERQYQLEKDIENNKYSSNIENKTNIGSVNEHDKKTAHIDPTVGEYIENGMSTVASASGGSADIVTDSEDDYCYEMSIPGTNKSLYIYTKKQHNEMAGGLIVPEDESNTASIENSSSIAIQGSGAGVSFADDSTGNGIAFNQTQLDNVINSLDKNAQGGILGELAAQLALNIIPAIPQVVSAIKARRDNSKVGSGLAKNMANNKLVAAMYNSLPSNKPAAYYNDIIKEFNAFKRVGSGINVQDGQYYASGKVMDGLKKFWNFIKTKYNENRDVFQPITNALLNTATSTVTDVVNKGTSALTNKVAEKTNNPHLNEIAKAVAKTGKDIGERVNQKITESASVLS